MFLIKERLPGGGKMKRNAVAVAVSALFIAPAAQAQIVMGNDTIGTVQFYGKLYPQFIRATSSGATDTGASVSTLASPTTGLCGTASSAGACNGTTAGSRLAVDSQNSYLGFRGERKFGNTGLKGIWQIEQSIELDGAVGGVFSNRNTFLGLAGGFGTVKLGNMDTIYKEYGQVEEIFGLTSGNFISPSNVLSQIGIGNSSTARFHERAKNSIQYQTPEFRGFQAGLQYSPDETKNDVGNTLNKELWSMGVKWESGPLYLSAQYERHKDFFGGSNNISSSLSNLVGGVPTPDAHSKDTGMRFSAAYKFGNHRIAGDIARLKYEESGQAAGTRFVSYEHTNWAISFESSWGGPWRTAIEWVRGGEGTCKLTIGDCSTTGLKGDLYGGGVAYDLDKQTFLYVLAAQLKNDPSAIYSNWAGSKPARGADITQIALGMAYRF
jgi:predicted porin